MSQKKEIRDTRIGKKKIKEFIFSSEMIVYIENSKWQ